MTDMHCANTILRQLGGKRFSVMTGAKDFLGSENALSFRIPRAKGGATRVRITLDSNDTYLIDTFKMKRGQFSLDVVESAEGVYADSLPEIFTTMTGLHTRL